MRRLITAALLGSAMLAAPAFAHEHEPVLGIWDTAAVTDFGTFEATMIVAAGEEGYSVEMVDVAPEGGQGMPPMESSISEVLVEGAALTFTRSLTTPQGPMELSYSFTAEGDVISGSANSSFGAIPVSGTRAAAEEEVESDEVEVAVEDEVEVEEAE